MITFLTENHIFG